MSWRSIDKILSIIFVILILSTSITLVYSIPRNIAEEPQREGNATYTEPLPKLFNSTPEELDTKLLEIIQKMNEAINITKRVDSSAAEILEGIRDSYITNIATGNFDAAERDMNTFSQILESIMRDRGFYSEVGIEDYSRLSDVVIDLYITSISSDELGEIVNPPRDVTSPPPDIIKDFNVSITPSMGLSPSLNIHLVGLSYYITVIIALVGVGLLLYFNRERIINVLDEVSIRLGIRKPPHQIQVDEKNFYRVFLDIARRRGYPKKDYEGPVEHIFRIDDEYLRSIGYEVAYAFEDHKYGLKKIDESRLNRIYSLLRGRR